MKTNTVITKVIFLDIDGVLQPYGAQDRFKQDMDALQVRLTKELKTDYTKIDKYDIAATYYDWFKPAVERLKSILQVTGAKLVISSNWREWGGLPKMKAIFAIHGLANDVVDITPIIPYSDPVPEKDKTYPLRAREIRQYLAAHPEVTSYVAIDDMDIARGLEGHFVYTSNFLTDEDCRKCVEILGSLN